MSKTAHVSACVLQMESTPGRAAMRAVEEHDARGSRAFGTRRCCRAVTPRLLGVTAATLAFPVESAAGQSLARSRCQCSRSRADRIRSAASKPSGLLQFARASLSATCGPFFAKEFASSSPPAMGDVGCGMQQKVGGGSRDCAATPRWRVSCVNRKDQNGKNLFQDGFLGLDNMPCRSLRASKPIRYSRTTCRSMSSFVSAPALVNSGKRHAFAMAWAATQLAE
jgi:hypothetical protein